MNKLKIVIVSMILMLLVSLAGPAFPVSARPLSQGVAAAVGLGTAEAYAVLAGSGITNINATTISGDVGSSPTSSETGFGSVTFVSGANHNDPDPNDAVTQGAKLAVTDAFTDAAGRSFSVVPSELGSTIKLPGVYKNTATSDFQLTGSLTLDAQGDPNAVFIFQSDTTLITASASSVNLINGAQACNVFWQVGSSATLGTGTNFIGTILADQAITDNGGSTVHGRLLTRIAAVTLNNTTINRPVCAVQPVEKRQGKKDKQNAISGLPSTGGAPIRDERFPWNLVVLGGVSALVLVLGLRTYRRAQLPK
jgi:hypothetical protein